MPDSTVLPTTCPPPFAVKPTAPYQLLAAGPSAFLCIFLGAGILAGCTAPSASVTPVASVTSVNRDINNTLPVTNVAERVQALLPLDALLLGEQHDAPDHQRIHREVIEALAARGTLAAVVLEMAMQGNSTASLGGTISATSSGSSTGAAGAVGAVVYAGSVGSRSNGDAGASEEAVRTALKWNEQAWPWATYAPAIMAAVRAGVPVIGSNMPRSQMAAAMQQPDLDQRLSGPALKAQQQLIRSGHCNLLPESQISPMTRIQIARDVAMANVIAQAHASAANAASPAKTVVLLAGSGHVDRTLGVPQHLPPGLKSRSVLLVAGSASDAGDRAADFDVVWSASPVPPQDYCAGLKAKMPG